MGDSVPVIQEEQAPSNDSARIDENIVEAHLFRSLENRRGPDSSFPEFHGDDDGGVFREDAVQEFGAGWDRDIPEDVEADGSGAFLEEDGQGLSENFVCEGPPAEGKDIFFRHPHHGDAGVVDKRTRLQAHKPVVGRQLQE